LRLYEAMLKVRPDVFVHCGDTIYADQPLAAEVKLDDGTISGWESHARCSARSALFGAAGSPSVALDAAVGYLVLAAVVAEGNVR
jgi:hypothetical protein